MPMFNSFHVNLFIAISLNVVWTCLMQLISILNKSLKTETVLQTQPFKVNHYQIGPGPRET